LTFGSISESNLAKNSKTSLGQNIPVENEGGIDVLNEEGRIATSDAL
jgi:hypothetical protein